MQTLTRIFSGSHVFSLLHFSLEYIQHFSIKALKDYVSSLLCDRVLVRILKVMFP